MSNTIERLRALLSEATPGRRYVDPDHPDQVRVDGEVMIIEAWGDRLVEDATAAAALHNAADALLAVAEAAQALYEAMDDSRMQHPRPLEEHQARAALRVRLAELDKVDL